MRAAPRQNGSFRQRADLLVPRLRPEVAADALRPDQPHEAEAKAIGTAAYLVNQYLFERARR